MSLQISNQMMRGIARAHSMSDQDDIATRGNSIRDHLIEDSIFRRSLLVLAGLLFVKNLTQETGESRADGWYAPKL